MEKASSSSSAATSTSARTIYDFLNRMRNPASLDLVRSIKSFIVSFTLYTANPENDGKKVQDFFTAMEACIADHPLWKGATHHDIDSAMEGLEKYVMTKLFSRTFSSSAEDTKMDLQLSRKIHSLQTFFKPHHLDISPLLHDEASCLLAARELQKINSFKGPSEKLMCVMNCCKVINDLLLNASMSENYSLAGADDFLPFLIYANPPQLHSNLRFIQLYRRQAKLVSEAAYYFTNLISSKSFIVDLNAKSLSMDEMEFEESMTAGTPNVPLSASDAMRTTSQDHMDPASLERMHNKDASGWSNYPYMEAEAGELTVKDVEILLNMYKDVVAKYTRLSRALCVRRLPFPKSELPVPHFELQETRVSLVQHQETNLEGE